MDSVSYQAVPTSLVDAGKLGEYRRGLAHRLADKIMPGDLLGADKAGRVARAAHYAALLYLEAEPENHFAVQREDYAHAAVGFRPSLRISPTYSRELRGRAKRETVKAMRRAEECLSPGQRWNLKAHPERRGNLRWFMLTLTMQHPAGQRTFDEVKRFNRAFSLLRKLDIWRKVFAGVKGVEDRITPDGSHVHAHLLILSRWIDAGALRDAWRKCIGGGGNVDLKIVKAKHRGESHGLEQITIRNAIDECVKYITKTSDLLEPSEDGREISPEQLIDLCDVWRWPRMFELLGMCRDCRASREARLDSIRPEYLTAVASGSVDESEPWAGILGEVAPDFLRVWHLTAEGDVEVGEVEHSPPRPRLKRSSWRELMLRLPAAEWLERIEARAEKQKKRRFAFLERATNGKVWSLQSCYA
jgi:hypothetical protein